MEWYKVIIKILGSACMWWLISSFFSRKKMKKGEENALEKVRKSLENGGSPKFSREKALCQEILDKESSTAPAKDLALYYKILIDWYYDEDASYTVLVEEIQSLKGSKHLSGDQKAQISLYLYVIIIRGYEEGDYDYEALRKNLKFEETNSESNAQRRALARHLRAIIDFQGKGLKSPHFEESLEGFEETLKNRKVLNEEALMDEAEYYKAEHTILFEGITAENVETLLQVYEKNMTNWSLCLGEPFWSKFRLAQVMLEEFPGHEANPLRACHFLEELLEDEPPLYYRNIYLSLLADVRSGNYGEKGADYKRAKKHLDDLLETKELDLRDRGLALLNAAKVMYMTGEKDLELRRQYLEELSGMSAKDVGSIVLIGKYYLAEMDLEGLGILSPNPKAAEAKLEEILKNEEMLPEPIRESAKNLLQEIKGARA